MPNIICFIIGIILLGVRVCNQNVLYSGN